MDGMPMELKHYHNLQVTWISYTSLLYTDRVIRAIIFTVPKT